jgi:hypothetical protein
MYCARASPRRDRALEPGDGVGALAVLEQGEAVIALGLFMALERGLAIPGLGLA